MYYLLWPQNNWYAFVFTQRIRQEFWDSHTSIGTYIPVYTLYICILMYIAIAIIPIYRRDSHPLAKTGFNSY